MDGIGVKDYMKSKASTVKAEKQHQKPIPYVSLPIIIAGFHCHAIKLKINYHPLNEVKKSAHYRR